MTETDMFFDSQGNLYKTKYICKVTLSDGGPYDVWVDFKAASDESLKEAKQLFEEKAKEEGMEIKKWDIKKVGEDKQ